LLNQAQAIKKYIFQAEVDKMPKKSIEKVVNPIAVSYKRNKEYHHIHLFDVNWVNVTYVKENSFDIGSVPYYEIFYEHDKLIKVNNTEILNAIPLVKQFYSENETFSFETLETLDPNKQRLYGLELDSAREMLNTLGHICRDSINDPEFLELRAYYRKYCYWIEEKLNFSFTSDNFYRHDIVYVRSLS
jgi:hypothetical protein